MKQLTILFLLMTTFFNSYSQDNELQLKLDSILAEADLLYKHEKAVWNATDLLMADKKVKKKYGGYVVSMTGDSVLVTFFNKDQNGSIARYTFTAADLIKPCIVSWEPSALTGPEKELLDIKTKIAGQLSDSKYDVTITEGFDPNFILLKDNAQFRFYIIMGTHEDGVIPFGNDYLFVSDTLGNIKTWQKLHSIMIPTYSKMGGAKVTSSSHSHLKTTPYITATDICTFRLYGKLCGQKEFSVLSTATGKYYKYNLKTNKIKIEEI